MNRNLPIYAALALCLSSMIVPALKAGELDKKTTLTVSQPIVVGDTVLPVGHYVLKLLNPSSSRDIVEILNGDGTRLITSMLAIPAYRYEPTGEVELSFYKTPEDNLPALHTWFYPGDTYGFEFLQPKHPAPAMSVGSN